MTPGIAISTQSADAAERAKPGLSSLMRRPQRAIAESVHDSAPDLRL